MLLGRGRLRHSVGYWLNLIELYVTLVLDQKYLCSQPFVRFCRQDRDSIFADHFAARLQATVFTSAIQISQPDKPARLSVIAACCKEVFSWESRASNEFLESLIPFDYYKYVIIWFGYNNCRTLKAAGHPLFIFVLRSIWKPYPQRERGQILEKTWRRTVANQCHTHDLVIISAQTALSTVPGYTFCIFLLVPRGLRTRECDIRSTLNKEPEDGRRGINGPILTWDVWFIARGPFRRWAKLWRSFGRSRAYRIVQPAWMQNWNFNNCLFWM